MVNENQNIINRRCTMLQKGFRSEKALAQHVGCTRQTVAKSMAAHGTRSDKSIAAVLGVSLAEFWPELYGPDVVGSKISNHNTTPDNFEKNLNEGRP